MMNLNQQNIFVYKTNIQNENDFYQIKDVLNNHQLIKNWSVDREDVDCVLRVVSTEKCDEEIIKILMGIGYECSEL